MISEFEIANFKSIKHLKSQCKRLNIFVGEPNAGKSNILESLGLLSFAQFSLYGSKLNDFVRYLRTTNLFYDDNIEEPISLHFGNLSLDLMFHGNSFSGKVQHEQSTLANITGDYNQLYSTYGPSSGVSPVKYYKYSTLPVFDRPESDSLLPPNGRNLLSILLTNRNLRSLTNTIFSRYGLKLVLKPHENQIEIIKQVEDILISYPFQVVSDTLQRVIFYLSAILSNKDSVLVFEEPESHAFPYYTKYLAEIMALDKNNNQYFIATHNPYFLEPIVEKTPLQDLNVFITYFENYQTKLRLLTENELSDLLNIDIFSNLDKYLSANDRS
jgi:AAA15 family ATPase/GTPase